jgi:hypothetical protein
MKTELTNTLRRHSIAAITFAAALLAVFASRAQAMSLLDGDFSSWNFTSTGSGGGSASMTLEASGGNPGARLNVTTSTGMTHTGSGFTQTAWGIGVNPNWTISQPLNGTQYSLSYDVIAGAGSFGQGQSVGLIVQQGTAYYLDIISTPVTGFQTSWTRESFTGTFDAANFRLQTGSGPSQPDFSGVTATTLGFTAFNGDSGTLTQYYDNISLTIAPIPEPSAWALFCLGSPVLLAFRHRKP